MSRLRGSQDARRGARCALSCARWHRRRGGEHAPGGRPHRRRRSGGDRPGVRRHRPDRRRRRRRRRVRRAAREPRRRHRDRHSIGGHVRVPAAARCPARGLRPRTGGPGMGTGSRRSDRGDGPVRHGDGRGRAGARRTARADFHGRCGSQPSRRRAPPPAPSTHGRMPWSGSPMRSSPARSPCLSLRSSRSSRSATPSHCMPDATSAARSWSHCDRAPVNKGKPAGLHRRSGRKGGRHLRHPAGRFGGCPVGRARGVISCDVATCGDPWP